MPLSEWPQVPDLVHVCRFAPARAAIDLVLTRARENRSRGVLISVERGTPAARKCRTTVIKAA